MRSTEDLPVLIVYGIAHTRSNNKSFLIDGYSLSLVVIFITKELRISFIGLLSPSSCLLDHSFLFTDPSILPNLFLLIDCLLFFFSFSVGIVCLGLFLRGPKEGRKRGVGVCCW